MDSEGLEFEDDALSKISEYGNGSMRDALSLLDQSISFGNGSVKDKDIKAMLGLVNHDDIFKLASLVIQRKADEVLLFVKELSHKGENLSNALKDLTSLFHEISIAQMISDDKQISAEIRSLATLISAQDLQLFYQIAINGQKDINYSPSEQIGLEMTLLRMIAFHPNNIDDEKKNLKLPKKEIVKHKANKKISESESLVDIKDSTVEKIIENKSHPSIKNQGDWEKIIYELSFSGAAKTVVKNTLFCSFSAGTITLTLNKEFNNLLTNTTQKSIEKKLGTIVDGISLVIELGETNGSTLSNKEANKLEQEKKQTEDQFLSDDGLKELENAFNSKVDKKSIKSLKESNNV
jgi:DNA polymerase-3 subunit gamma/tau